MGDILYPLSCHGPELWYLLNNCDRWERM